MPINLEKWVTLKGEEQAAKQSASPRHELGMFRENGAGLRGAPTGLGQGDGPHHQLAGTKAGVAPTQNYQPGHYYTGERGERARPLTIWRAARR